MKGAEKAPYPDGSRIWSRIRSWIGSRIRSWIRRRGSSRWAGSRRNGATSEN